MTFYKIRERSTGLYSTGGMSPNWSTKGKVWKSVHHVKLHLALVGRAAYVGSELVAFEQVERESVPMDEMARMVDLKKQMEKDRRERSERDRQRREDLRELKRLKEKYER